MIADFSGFVGLRLISEKIFDGGRRSEFCILGFDRRTPTSIKMDSNLVGKFFQRCSEPSILESDQKIPRSLTDPTKHP